MNREDFFYLVPIIGRLKLYSDIKNKSKKEWIVMFEQNIPYFLLGLWGAFIFYDNIPLCPRSYVVKLILIRSIPVFILIIPLGFLIELAVIKLLGRKLGGVMIGWSEASRLKLRDLIEGLTYHVYHSTLIYLLGILVGAQIIQFYAIHS